MNLKGILLIFLFYIIIFQDALQTYIPFFSIFDEIFSIVLIALAICKLWKNQFKIEKHLFKILIVLVCIVLIGLLSNMLFSYQGYKYIFLDIISNIRIWLIYVSAYILLNKASRDMLVRILPKHIKFISILLFILSIINIFLPIFPYYDVRNGIATQMLFFHHPTYLSAMCIALIIILVGLRIDQRNRYILLLTFVVIMTGRVKSIGFLLAWYTYIYFFTKGKKIKIRYIIIIILLLMTVGYKRALDQLFLNPLYPRSVLNKYSIYIANDHFPLGSGFATYASFMSGQSPSPIYEIYQINNVYGLSKADNYAAVNDAFWPMIIGQFGYIALILYIYLLCLLIFHIYKNNREYKRLFLPLTGSLGYLLISSISESSFVNYYSVVFMLIMAFYSKEKDVQSRRFVNENPNHK